MQAYVYHWYVRPEGGVAVELRVTAPSAVVARHRIRSFLVEHDGEAWTVECVSRETTRAPAFAIALPPRGSGGPSL